MNVGGGPYESFRYNVSRAYDSEAISRVSVFFLLSVSLLLFALLSIPFKNYTHFSVLFSTSSCIALEHIFFSSKSFGIHTHMVYLLICVSISVDLCLLLFDYSHCVFLLIFFSLVFNETVTLCKFDKYFLMDYQFIIHLNNFYCKRHLFTI